MCRIQRLNIIWAVSSTTIYNYIILTLDHNNFVTGLTTTGGGGVMYQCKMAARLGSEPSVGRETDLSASPGELPCTGALGEGDSGVELLELTFFTLVAAELLVDILDDLCILKATFGDGMLGLTLMD